MGKILLNLSPISPRSSLDSHPVLWVPWISPNPASGRFSWRGLFFLLALSMDGSSSVDFSLNITSSETVSRLPDQKGHPFLLLSWSALCASLIALSTSRDLFIVSLPCYNVSFGGICPLSVLFPIQWIRMKHEWIVWESFTEEWAFKDVK